MQLRVASDGIEDLRLQSLTRRLVIRPHARPSGRHPLHQSAKQPTPLWQGNMPLQCGEQRPQVENALTAVSAIKVIGGALSEEKGIDGQKILASDAAFQASVKTPKNMDGKTFGMRTAGSSFHYMASRIAAAEGIKLKFKPLQKVGAIIGALKSGQIDAWSIVPHIGKGLAKSGKVHIIGDVADYIPDYQVTTVFTSAKNAANERDMTAAFLTAFSRGVDDFNAAMVDKTAGDDAMNQMVDLIHKYVYADRPHAKAAPSIINGSMRLNKGAALNLKSISDQLDWFKSEKLVKPGITIDTLVDATYVRIIK